MKKIIRNSKRPKFKELYYTNPRDPKNRTLICRIHEKRKKIEYFVRPNVPQYRWVQTIKIDGFAKLPGGLSRSGTGLLPKRSGYLIARSLYEKFGTFDLAISLKLKTRITKRRDKYKIIMNYSDLRVAQDNLREVSNENYKTLVSTAEALLNKFFPKYFDKKTIISGIEYKGNQLGRILKKDKLMKNLSRKDIQALIDFFPPFIKRFGREIKGEKELISVLKSKNAVELVYLEELIKAFERKMGLKIQNEHSWQKFFRDHFLIFNPSYINVFEKRNLSLSGKFPDFLPIDIYGHLDIFDIKRPNTKLMNYDDSRKNYYWSKELSKAIAQVENYIHNAIVYSPQLIQEIKRQEEIDIKVVKPRGYIIAGSRNQLNGQIISEYFRLLNESLKNVRVILYDDVLDNLRAFLKKAIT